MEQPSAQFVTQVVRTFLKPIYSLLETEDIELIYLSPPQYSPLIFSSKGKTLLDPIPQHQVELTVKQLLQALNISEFNSILEFNLLTPLNSLAIVPSSLPSNLPTLIIKKTITEINPEISRVFPNNTLEYISNSLLNFRTILLSGPLPTVKKTVLPSILEIVKDEKILVISNDTSFSEEFPSLLYTSLPPAEKKGELEKLISYLEPRRLLIELSALPLQSDLLLLLQNYPGSIALLNQPSLLRAIHLLSNSLKAILYPAYPPFSISTTLASLIQLIALFKLEGQNTLSLSQLAEIELSEEKISLKTIWPEPKEELASPSKRSKESSKLLEISDPDDTLRVKEPPHRYESELSNHHIHSAEPTEKYHELNNMVQKIIEKSDVQNRKNYDNLHHPSELNSPPNLSQSSDSSRDIPAPSSPVNSVTSEDLTTSKDSPPSSLANALPKSNRTPPLSQPEFSSSPGISSSNPPPTPSKEHLPQLPFSTSNTDISTNPNGYDESHSGVFNKPTKMVPVTQLPQLREKLDDYSHVLKLEDVIEDSLPSIVSDDELKEIERELQQLNSSPLKNTEDSKNQTIWGHTTTRGVGNSSDSQRPSPNFNNRQKFRYFDPQELEDTANISQENSGERKGVLVKRGRGKNSGYRSSSRPAPKNSPSMPTPPRELQLPNYQLDEELEATIIKGSRPPIIKKNK